MKITEIETIPINVPLKAEFAIRGQKGVHNVSPFLLVKVHTSEGVAGVGEASCTPRWSGEDQVTAAHFVGTLIAPALVGQEVDSISRLSVLMDTVLAGNWFTKGAVEMALWDAAGKVAGEPVHKLLGGAVRERVATKWSISGREPAAAAAIARWAVAQGFGTMKVKVGIDPAEDIERVRAVRAAVGDGVRLGIDANGAWDVPTAVRVIDELKTFGIYFAEQPVAAGDHEAMAEVRRQVKLPIIADESVYTPADARALVRAQAADVFSIYVGKSGGLARALEIASVAKDAGLKCTIGSNLELGVGTAAMIHLALALPALAPDDFPCDIIGPFYYEDDILAEPLPLRAGEARLLENPGLGIELDEQKIARYRV